MGSAPEPPQPQCEGLPGWPHQGPVETRGRVVPLGVFCEGCWARYRNQAACGDGVSGPQPEEPDPDDVQFHEPLPCPECGSALRLYRTNYGHWVAVEDEELPAKEVPRLFRWRLQSVRARHSPVTIAVVAVRVTGDLGPSEPVRPAHRFRCYAGQDDVHEERTRDRANRYRQRDQLPDNADECG